MSVYIGTCAHLCLSFIHLSMGESKSIFILKIIKLKSAYRYFPILSLLEMNNKQVKCLFTCSYVIPD